MILALILLANNCTTTLAQPITQESLGLLTNRQLEKEYYTFRDCLYSEYDGHRLKGFAALDQEIKLKSLMIVRMNRFLEFIEDSNLMNQYIQKGDK